MVCSGRPRFWGEALSRSPRGVCAREGRVLCLDRAGVQGKQFHRAPGSQGSSFLQITRAIQQGAGISQPYTPEGTLASRAPPWRQRMAASLTLVVLGLSGTQMERLSWYMDIHTSPGHPLPGWTVTWVFPGLLVKPPDTGAVGKLPGCV